MIDTRGCEKATKINRKGAYIVVNVRKIKARMVELGMTQREVSKAMGIEISSFNLKLNNTKNRQFTITEAQKLVTVLKIENPNEYFFST
jgi:transcriptional regulator with XRE-family HTH domain